MPPRIALNDVEAKFIDLLDDFARQLQPPVECRVAGGWLLALPSHDLDIALSIPSGHTFAVSFVEYLKHKDVPTSSVGKVAANPEQSKHLETGTTRILGLECDFVGLRSETYADSRIPQVTFQDDPLRILRCVRFASRFNLTIEEHVKDAIREEDVKVSKERIGIEVSKMIGKNPLKAMTLISDLGLHEHVFSCDLNPPRHSAYESAQILSNLVDRFDVDDSLWLATAATPFDSLIIKRKGKDVPAPAILVSEALKSPNVRPWRRSITWAAVMAVLPSWTGVWNTEVEGIVQRYEAMRERIVEQGLPEAIDQPLLINQLLSISPSPLLQTIRQALNVWQLGHPEGSKEQAETWLKQAWAGEERAMWEEQSRPKKASQEKRKR
ncbi:hypothetical protein IAU60_002223 [Kwoniella sp. DSM 27419]